MAIEVLLKLMGNTIKHEDMQNALVSLVCRSSCRASSAPRRFRWMRQESVSSAKR